MIIKKLSEMPYAQAHVEIHDEAVYLFSYNTLVVEISADNWLTCTGTYSQTTRRHIGAFMREYVRFPNGDPGDYYTARNAFLGNYRLNLETGEILMLGESE